MNVKEFRVKIHLIQFFGFNLGHFNMYTYYVKWNQFHKGQSKGPNIYKTIIEKNIDDKNILATPIFLNMWNSKKI